LSYRPKSALPAPEPYLHRITAPTTRAL